MTGDLLPVLWLCGPPGVGKTVVGWEIRSRLADSGVGTAFVDIDQLGICYPEPPSDPGRHRLQERGLRAVVEGFRSAGARCVVVAGVVDAQRGVERDAFERVALTVCRLRADHDELAARFLSRGMSVELVERVLLEAEKLEAASFADLCVDTTGKPVAVIADEVWERSGVRPADPGPARDEPAGPADGRVVWICGATGVGKSEVGFEVYRRTLGAGHTAAYLDLDQLGLCTTTDDAAGAHRLKARNAAAVWRVQREAGADHLVVVGPVEDAATVAMYAGALAPGAVTVCRLHAGREQLTERVLARGRGSSWSQPGDPMRGRSEAHLRAVAAAAAEVAEGLERADLGDFSVDTDERTAVEAADVVMGRIGWAPAQSFP
ncbi:AAA family ATPase [Actinomycetes bacterium KLBMP 9759]